MATNVSSVVSHFPDAENGFTTTTAGSVSSGAATVTLNGIGGYTNGEPVVLVIDPTDAAKKQTFTGIVDTAGVQVTSVVWTAGTNQTHALGATVVDYATATHIAMMSKGIKVNHTQKGNHKTLTDDNANEWIGLTTTASAINYLDVANAAIGTNPILSAKGDDTNIGLTLTPKGSSQVRVSGGGGYDSWVYNALPAVSSVTENGNRSADITFASTVASLLTPGMRIRTSRTVAAPTFMGGAFNGTTHYFTKVTATSTLSTVTDNFTLMAHVEPTAYTNSYICGRSDATPTNAFGIKTESTGQVTCIVFNAGAVNFRYFTTYQSLPLNKKTHVAASWASGTVVIYFDGVSVPVGTASTGGTAPTTAGTGGDFSIGRLGAFNNQYFTGYISGCGVFNSVLSAATIRSYKNQVLSGSETNCIGAWSLNNTGVNQQAAGTNDLTATNSVSYTVRSPYSTDANGVNAGTYDWAIVTKVATTVATVQYPEGCAIPTSGGISTVDYSGVKAPFGMPTQKDRWEIVWIYKSSMNTGAVGANVITNLGSTQLLVPVGAWDLGFDISLDITHAGSSYLQQLVSLSTSSSTVSDQDLTALNTATSTVITEMITRVARRKSISVLTATPYYMLTQSAIATTTQYITGVTGNSVIKAELANL